MSQDPRFTFATFFIRFALRLTGWLVCCVAVPYALKCYEDRTVGGIFAVVSADARPAPAFAANSSDDAGGPSGAIVGFAAQQPPPQHRYVVRPIVPFRTGFRGFVYESLDGSPVTHEVAVASIDASSKEEPFVEGRLSGYCPPAGVDLTTEPFRLGNIPPVPHPAGGWFLVCGVIFLMLLPWPQSRIPMRA
jgi:hypothetical protein